MAIAEELIAGVVSSVLAVLLVEIYLWLRRRYRHRALRWLVGTDTVSVITPVYPWAENAHPAGLLTTYDAIGLAHVLEACNRVGTVPVVTRSGESAENSPLDVVAIGGPSGNQVTSTFLKAYCPGFEVLTDSETGQLSYRCGDRVFSRTDDETFAFIVRLSPRETGLPGTALIVWGHSAVATASAGYYLARYSQSLRKVGKGSFFVAISVRWVLGYRSFDTRPIDLTREAFAPRPVRAALPAALPPTSVPEPVDEPTPRRRFGRSTPVAAPVSTARSTATGRSRVADALDDVRAESTTVVTAARSSSVPSPGASFNREPSGGTSSGGASRGEVPVGGASPVARRSADEPAPEKPCGVTPAGGAVVAGDEAPAKRPSSPEDLPPSTERPTSSRTRKPK